MRTKSWASGNPWIQGQAGESLFSRLQNLHLCLCFRCKLSKESESVGNRPLMTGQTMSSWDLLPLSPDWRQIVMGLRAEERGRVGWPWISVSGLLSLGWISTSADWTLDAKLTPGILGVQRCNQYVLCRVRQAPTSSSVLSWPFIITSQMAESTTVPSSQNSVNIQEGTIRYPKMWSPSYPCGHPHYGTVLQLKILINFIFSWVKKDR